MDSKDYEYSQMCTCLLIQMRNVLHHALPHKPLTVLLALSMKIHLDGTVDAAMDL